MISLFTRNLFFAILQPGIVAGLIPYLIAGDKIKNIIHEPVAFFVAIAFLIFFFGFLIMISCIISFAVKGKGTLSPADPTQKLVISGLYRFSRNPMYVGVLLMLVGEAVMFQNCGLLLYGFFVLVIFNIFTIFVEEPRLKRDFGNDYVIYCKKVRRWL